MASQFSRDDVLRIAALSRLELNDAEIDLFATQLGNILEYARIVDEVATTGVAPMSHVTASETPSWREDTPVASLSRDDVMAVAPDADRAAGLFRVPKVL